MYACVFVCINPSVRVCTSVLVYVRILRVCTDMYGYVRMCAYICMYVRMCMDILRLGTVVQRIALVFCAAI